MKKNSAFTKINLRNCIRKHGKAAILSFILGLLLIASTHAALSSVASIQTYGTVTYPPRPLSIQTEATNWASFSDNCWYTDSTWKRCPTLDVYADTTATHQGQPTFRIEPDFSGNGNSGADHWGPAVKPGDHIVMGCWIKTGGSTPQSFAGGRMGLDYYDRSDHAISAAVSQLSASTGTYGTDAEVNHNYVHWGSDWTYRQWDFIVPATVQGSGQSTYYPVGSSGIPALVVPWIQVWDINYPDNACTCWFSGFTLYVNP